VLATQTNCLITVFSEPVSRLREEYHDRLSVSISATIHQIFISIEWVEVRVVGASVKTLSVVHCEVVVLRDR